MSRVNSIGFKLFLALTLIVVGAVLALTSLYWVGLGTGFREYVARMELSRLEPIESHLVARYEREGSWHFVKRPQDLLPERLQRPVDMPPPRPDDMNAPRLEADVLSLGRRVALFDEQGRLVMGRPEAEQQPRLSLMSRQGQVIGYLALAPASQAVTGSEGQFLAQQGRNLLWALVIAILLSACAAVVMASYFRKPITALAEAARQLAQGNLQARVAIIRNDELGLLAADFNQMAKKLENFEMARRQWVADTSHELRTPLTILRVQVEAMRDGIMPLSQKGLTQIESGIRDLDALVDDLYQLARSDVGNHDFHPSVIALPEFIDGLMAQFAEPMRKAELSLSAGSIPKVKVILDEHRLHQLFSNLLTNSLRYTHGGGHVKLEAEMVGDKVRITLDDSAPSVPNDSLDRLFERFYRVDASHNRRSGGAGLGLAICQSIVQAMGGSISAEHSALGGVRIIVCLPLSQGGGAE